MRHTFATTLLDKGVDLKTVQNLMGHSHIRTTEQYLHSTDDRIAAPEFYAPLLVAGGRNGGDCRRRPEDTMVAVFAFH
jgi:hypothetical protein